ncbi:MAG: hypothetical protein ACM3ML_23120 [Micromonosporaceae bacterium]
MWAFPVLGCALRSPAVLRRRWPLTALAVMLGGLVATTMTLTPASPITLPIVFAGAAAIEVCYIAATRRRIVSVTAQSWSAPAC